MTPPPLALCAVAAAAQRALPGSGPTRSSRVVGGIVAAASAAVVASAVREFRRSQTTVDPRREAAPTQLVTTGMSARSRNPMYVGMAGALVAHAIAQRSAAALLPVGLFVAWIDRAQITMEEAALRAEFGADFESYSSRVRRWL